MATKKNARKQDTTAAAAPAITPAAPTTTKPEPKPATAFTEMPIPLPDDRLEALMGRFDALFENRHYEKTNAADLWGTILNAGLKQIERRRRKTRINKITNAIRTLKGEGMPTTELEAELAKLKGEDAADKDEQEG